MEPNQQELAIQLQAVIDTAIDGIITISDSGIIESFNNSASNLFGYKAEEVIGKNVKILMPDPYHTEHDQYLDRYNRTKVPHIIGIGREVKGRRKSGDIFPLKLSVAEVILHDRVIFTGITHDLTEIDRAKHALEKANEELERKVDERTQQLENIINEMLATNKKLEASELQLTEALTKEKELNEMKSRFVSMASHEFRTPLSTILSSVSLISRYTTEETNAKRLKHVDRIKAAVTNLTGILNDFLSLSKLEENKIQIQQSEFSINELCEEIKKDLSGILKDNQELIIDHKVDSAFIKSDKNILRNIFFNLMSNAIKYSSEDIFCELTADEDFLYVKIRDQGIGIPLEDQKHLFSRFFRASNVENIQGTGLGLNIVKIYIELLKGQIDFKSVPHEGTTFFVKIPNNI